MCVNSDAVSSDQTDFKYYKYVLRRDLACRPFVGAILCALARNPLQIGGRYSNEKMAWKGM